MRLHYYLQRIRESSKSFLIKKLKITFKKIYFYPWFWCNKYLNLTPKYFQKNLNKRSAIFSEEFTQNIFKHFANEKIKSDLLRQISLPMQDQFQCLGFGVVNIGNDNWYQDCIHQFVWPLKYFPRVDFVQEKIECDVKIAWEKSRLQFLVPLGILFVLTRDKSYLEKIKTILRNWHQYNPCGFGVNWCSAMEVAIRSVNILLSFSMVYSSLTDEDKLLFTKVLHGHYFYLEHFPEISDIAGNHYLATEMGLTLFKLFLSKDDQRQKIVTRFSYLANDQFTDDGLHLEFSPSYHRLCLDILLIVSAFAKYFKLANTHLLDNLINRAYMTCRQLADANGMLPLFSDNDSAKVIDLHQDERNINYHESLLQRLLQSISNHEYLFANTAFVKRYLKPFCVLQTSNAKLVMRCGELGLKGRAAHDHDDNLSFWLTAFKEEIITETGTYPYTLRLHEREKSILSSSHNVIQAKNKARLSPQKGSVFKSVRGAATAELVEIKEDFLHSRLQANSYVGCPTTHERKCYLAEMDNKIIFKLIDYFKFSDADYFSSYLHLSENFEDLIQIDNHSYQLKTKHSIIDVKIASHDSANLTTQLEDYDHCSRYGKRLKCKRLKIEGKVTQNNFLTVDFIIAN